MPSKKTPTYFHHLRLVVSGEKNKAIWMPVVVVVVMAVLSSTGNKWRESRRLEDGRRVKANIVSPSLMWRRHFTHVHHPASRKPRVHPEPLTHTIPLLPGCAGKKKDTANIMFPASPCARHMAFFFTMPYHLRWLPMPLLSRTDIYKVQDMAQSGAAKSLPQGIFFL